MRRCGRPSITRSRIGLGEDAPVEDRKQGGRGNQLKIKDAQKACVGTGFAIAISCSHLHKVHASQASSPKLRAAFGRSFFASDPPAGVAGVPRRAFLRRGDPLGSSLGWVRSGREGAQAVGDDDQVHAADSSRPGSAPGRSFRDIIYHLLGLRSDCGCPISRACREGSAQ